MAGVYIAPFPADGLSKAKKAYSAAVLPGMEGTHWPVRKARRKDWPRLMELLRITRLDRVLTVKPTQMEAVRSIEGE